MNENTIYKKVSSEQYRKRTKAGFKLASKQGYNRISNTHVTQLAFYHQESKPSPVHMGRKRLLILLLRKHSCLPYIYTEIMIIAVGIQLKR